MGVFGIKRHGIIVAIIEHKNNKAQHMFDLGSIVAHIKADVSDFKKGISDAQDQAKGLAGKFGDATEASKGLMVGVAGAGLAAAGFAALAVKNWSDQEDAAAQMDAVLASTHHSAGLFKEDLMQQADALQNLTKFSNEQVMATQNMLLTFTEIKGPVMQGATAAALDMAQALGMDGKEAALQLGKALNDPADGMTKLQRVGVTFTDKQKETAKQMVATGNVAGAQGLILAELSKEFGGSATAAGKTLSGQLTILKNNFGDMLKPIGEAITNGIKPLIKWFNDLVKNSGGPEEFVKKVGKAFKDLLPWLLPVATAIMAALVPALLAMAAGAWAAVAPLLPFIAVGLLVGLAVKTLMDHFGGLHALLGVLKQAWDFLKPSIDALWNTIQKNLIPTIEGIWNKVAPVLIPALKVLAEIVGVVVVGAIWLAINILNIIIGTISTTIGIISGLVAWFWKVTSGVRDTFGQIVGVIDRALGGIWNAITEPFRKAFDWVKKEVDKVVGKLKDLNPFQRHSPSLFDLVSAGTQAISGQYRDMFDVIGQVPSAASLAPGLGVGANNAGAIQPAAAAAGGTTVTVNLDGVLASSQADLRTVAKQLVGAIDEELAAKGKPTILPAGVS